LQHIAKINRGTKYAETISRGFLPGPEDTGEMCWARGVLWAGTTMAGTTCLHCKSPIEDAHAPAGYCCAGCSAVARLLQDQGLTRYYALQGSSGVGPSQVAARTSDLAWLEAPLAAAVAGAHNGVCRLDVDVQGIRCSACVWLLRELFMRQDGALDAVVNPGVGRVALSFSPGTPVAQYLTALEGFGYRAGPKSKDAVVMSDRVLFRLGVVAALTMNSMMFTISHYLGMTPADGEVFSLMRWLNLLFTVGVLYVGGSEFFTRAWFGLRRRQLNFDLPIALGLTLAFAGSLLVFVRQPDTFSYFDTLNTFTTLMLVGRWLQERLLERNRAQLLRHDGLEGLYARRLEDGRLCTVAATSIQRGDVVLLAPGALLVTEATLLEDHGSFSLDWINGESVPRDVAQDAVVPAGAFNAGRAAVRLKATTDFHDSTLVPLLASGPAATTNADGDPLLLQRLTRFYVPAVLLSALAAVLFWINRDVDRAIAATTAVLVVTCPCALGLAIPLAYQRALASLRLRGLFVRRGGFLDRACNITQVVFDKTGTLTLGQLTLANPEALHALPVDVLAVLSNMTARSTHPRSRCVLAALEASHGTFDPSITVTEHPGEGLEGRRNGKVVRLGSPAFTGQLGRPNVDAQDLCVTVDGVGVATLQVKELLRWDARAELQALRNQGLKLALLSGDAPDRVARAAGHLGLLAQEAAGGLSPKDKADWLRRHGGPEHTLFIGDGVNDHPGFDVALCSGTPAVEHPALSARADFYFLTSGVGVVRSALHTAQTLRRVVKNIRLMALSYNALAVAACVAGWVSPVLAAVAMPTSSILILLYTIRATRLVGATTTPRQVLTAPAPAVAS